MSDHSCQHYYEAVRAKNSGAWRFKIYHYDATGNTEVVVHQSAWDFASSHSAEDAATEWLEEHGIAAELS